MFNFFKKPLKTKAEIVFGLQAELHALSDRMLIEQDTNQFLMDRYERIIRNLYLQDVKPEHTIERKEVKLGKNTK